MKLEERYVRQKQVVLPEAEVLKSNLVKNNKA